MKIIITGGTGFIGQALTKHFLAKGVEISIIGRDASKMKEVFANQITAITWDDFKKDPQNILQSSDVVINLAGANIAEKMDSSKKKEILNSRIETTQLIANHCAKLEKPPILLNASGVGIYGMQAVTPSLPQPFDENQPITDETAPDFMSEVARQWEKATLPAKEKGVRVVNMRFAGVLGRGGLLNKLKLPFSLGLGGPIGSGNQPFSWIALDDLIRAIDFLIVNNQIKGPVNFVSPQCISQKQFAQTFAKVLHRPCFLKTPAFVLKSIFGEMAATLLLNGQCAYPKLLLEEGFKFKYPDIETTLRHLYRKNES